MHSGEPQLNKHGKGTSEICIPDTLAAQECTVDDQKVQKTVML